MTVKEFIEKLQGCGQNKTVWVSCFDGVEEYDTHADIEETVDNVYIV